MGKKKPVDPCVAGLRALLHNLDDDTKAEVSSEIENLIQEISERVVGEPNTRIKRKVASVIEDSKRRVVVATKHKVAVKLRTGELEDRGLERSMIAMHASIHERALFDFDDFEAPMGSVLSNDLKGARVVAGSDVGKLLSDTQFVDIDDPTGKSTVSAADVLLPGKKFRPEYNDALAHELGGVRTPIGDKDPAIRGLAGRLHDLTEDMQRRHIALGRPTHLIKDGYIPQFYSSLVIQKDKTGFVDDLVRHLERSQYGLEDASEDEVRTLATKFADDIIRGTDGVSDGTKSVVDKRKIRLSSGQARVDFIQKYGESDSIVALMTHKLSKMREEEVLMTTWGPEPYKAIKETREAISAKVEKHFADLKVDANELGVGTKAYIKRIKEIDKLKAKSDKSSNTIDMMSDYYQGKFSPATEAQMALHRRAIMVQQYIMTTTLGSIGLYTPLDMSNGARRMAPLKHSSAAKTLGEYSQALSGLSDKAVIELSDYVGVRYDNMASAMHENVFAEVVDRGLRKPTGAEAALDKGTDVLLSVSLTKWGANGIRTGHMASWMDVFAKVKSKGASMSDLATIDPILHERWSAVGFDDKMLSRILDDDHFPGGHLDISKIKDTKLRSTLAGFMHREADLAMNYPDDWLKAKKASLIKPGTKIGTIGSLAAMYTTYSMAFWRGSAATAWREGGVKGYAALAAGLVVVTGLKIAVNDILEGKPPREFTDPTLWVDAFEQSNAMSYATIPAAIIGQELADDDNTFDAWREFGFALDNLRGPVAGKGLDLLKLGVNAGSVALDLATTGGYDEDTAVKTILGGKSFVPYNNALVWKGALIWGVNQILEDVKPGYLSEREATYVEQKRQNLF